MIYVVGIFWALFFVAVLYGLWKYIPKSACNKQCGQGENCTCGCEK